jgi:hypothetical protein
MSKKLAIWANKMTYIGRLDAGVLIREVDGVDNILVLVEHGDQLGIEHG